MKCSQFFHSHLGGIPHGLMEGRCLNNFQCSCYDDKQNLPRVGGVPYAQIVEKYLVGYVGVQMEGGKCESQPSTSV